MFNISEIKRNLSDFQKEIDELKSYIDGNFKNQSIDNLESLYKQSECVISEWRYLSSSVDEAIDFISNIEDNQ